eukprot:Blabericola_migrator_1__4167@NODE_2274_length_3020_cov_422_052828_g1431_i0_p1_GENE_NODE_2274_length_3020_cov_422_052828_g1431_i0NODE_2274_length_3020_cov_422_052828_g1431_i0_p1_ORF_typecomplete_len556_score95_58MFS_1/PF07690_16/32MFS_1/PF07690_16/9e13MFS_1/PF07690_16/1e08Sugar_tr/PF00083_24/1_6e09Patched/PF02460_18/0_0021CcmD/PF04995_14/1_4e02CcmD/PF04995_14/0_34NDUF_B12/PF08122_12/1_2Wzy_C_2/PF11846_8/11Wzy_C_2/PF11846_8/4_6e02Wzy_C_2/PF11846_8/4_7e02_NODE_2274_length_3020_cov_422_052828_g1431_
MVKFEDLSRDSRSSSFSNVSSENDVQVNGLVFIDTRHELHGASRSSLIVDKITPPEPQTADRDVQSTSSVGPAVIETMNDKQSPLLEKQNAFLAFIQGKWVRMIVFVLACFFTSCVYYGWQQYAQMLIKGGAYSWLCDVDDPECDAQSKAVGNLYSVAAGCEYASAAIGGLLLDHAGPRLSAVIGESMWIIGTVLLAISSQHVNLYILAMIIIGSSVNVVCFPSLCTIETWPKYHGVMVGIVLAAQTAATAIPPVLWAMWRSHPSWTFRGIWLVYGLGLGIPIALLYIAALPGKRDFQKILQLQRLEVMKLQKIEGRTEVDKDDQSTISGRKGDIEAQIEGEQTDGVVMMRQKKASWSEFGRNICTIDMLCMAGWFCTTMMMYAYYSTVVRDAIGDKISDYVAYIQPSQALWSLLAGYLCDVYRTGYVMLGLCACLCLCCGLSLKTSSAGLQYFASTLLIVSQSAIFEVKYTYVGEMFDPYNYGKLVGCLGVIGGVGTFLNIPVSAGTDYNRVFIAYCITAPVLGLVAMWLVWRQKRGVTYKSLPEVVADGSAQA